MIRHMICAVVLQFASVGAQACLFATSTPPEGWYQWSAQLFAGDVTAIEKDAARPVDVLTVRVVETFKGPDAAEGTLTVRIPSRHWAACKVQVPAAGERVLVALNANSDAMLVPLSAGYADKLRALKR